MSRLSFGGNEFGIRNQAGVTRGRSRRRIAPVATLGMLILTVLGMSAVPAFAADDAAAGTPSGDITQALIVGGLAFAMIIALAGAVLYHTAKGRRRNSVE